MDGNGRRVCDELRCCANHSFQRRPLTIPVAPQLCARLFAPCSLGWNGLSLNGNNDEVQTPYTTALAKEQGVRFTSHYVYKFCSPTRASFLTGRIPGHGIQETNLGFVSESACNGNLTMISAKMKQAGYVTAQIGKW